MVFFVLLGGLFEERRHSVLDEVFLFGELLCDICIVSVEVGSLFCLVGGLLEFRLDVSVFGTEGGAAYSYSEAFWSLFVGFAG